jgi:hypothetical protein
VTHLDVDPEGIEHAVKVLSQSLAGTS